MEKIKKLTVKRPFLYKAYRVELGTQYTSNNHTGELVAKSECHYYCEKEVLDYLQANQTDTCTYLIYQVSKDVDTFDHEDRLVETIAIKEGNINISLE